MINVSPDQKPDLLAIPKSPGVYVYHDEKGDIIYIGKAKNLINRIRSYFTNIEQHSIKTRHLVSKIRQIEWIIVDNEMEALLLENNLIKKHSPRYNINLKDAKTFAYIKLTSEKYPRIISTRRVTRDGIYFGPYTDGQARRELARLVVHVFKIRTCKDVKRPCLNYHLGLCTCHDQTPEEYNMQVEQAKEFLKGNTETVAKRLELEMKEASKEKRFELALEKKNQLVLINNIFERQKAQRIERFDQDIVVMLTHNENSLFYMLKVAKGTINGKEEYKLDSSDDIFAEFLKRYYAGHNIPREIIINTRFYADDDEKKTLEQYFSSLRGGPVDIILPERGEKLALVRLAEKNAAMNLEENKTLRELQEKLGLPGYPKVIECFDISNLGYDHVVAGMTRFVDGRPDKSGYRKFLIRSLKGKQDDFAAMLEAVYRRYKRLKLEKAEYPGLIIIDGGPGQLNSALRSLRVLGLKLPVIGLAKEHEEIYLPGKPEPLHFDNNSKMMLLVREIRDSVHHFVLGYNKKRREMALREDYKNNA